MSRGRLVIIGLLLCGASAAPVTAQDTGIHWQQDIEAAKASAQQTGRLVLVHVWTDQCGPCRALDQNVFNQPNVGAAVEAKFVPVKLNANEYPATAQGFGITRVPTDVILTPDGRVIGKMISPATPTAYIAEVTQVANQYATRQGAAFQNAVAAAPQPPMLNSAYAALPIGAPIAPSTTGAGSMPAPTSQVASASPAAPYNRYALAGQTSMPLAAPANPYAMPQTPSAAPTVPSPPPATSSVPPVTTNNYATNYYATSAQQVQTPAPVTPGPQATLPNVAGNPYFAPTLQQPATTHASPFAPGYGSQPPIAVPQDMNVPPTSSAGVPFSAEAMNSRTAPPTSALTSAGPTAQIPTASPSTSAVAGDPSAPDPSKMPPGAPPLAFGGYCPVTMRTAWKWMPGDAKFGAIHRDRTYWFVGPREQQQFLANPDFFAPALSGIDPVLAIDHRQSVPGTREHSIDYDNQFYMFSSEATLQQFTANPERYATGARQAMGLQPKRQMR